MLKVASSIEDEGLRKDCEGCEYYHETKLLRRKMCIFIPNIGIGDDGIDSPCDKWATEGRI